MNNTHSPAWIIDEDGYIIYMNDIFKKRMEAERESSVQ